MCVTLVLSRSPSTHQCHDDFDPTLGFSGKVRELLPFEHQYMGAGWTKGMVQELEHVTGKGIGALARLCQMRGLTWRSVAYFYCAVLKDPAGRAEFLSKLGRLK